jgi:hypothetical protein
VQAVSVEMDGEEEQGEGMALGEAMRDEQTKSVDCGARSARKANAVGQAYERRSWVMTTRFWRTGGPPFSLFSDQGKGG